MILDPATAVLDIGGKLIDRLWPDPSQADAAKLELYKLHESGELARISGQTDINKIEASNPSLLVSGWRPMVGWVCVAGLGYQFLVYPIAHGYMTNIAQLDMGTLLTLLMGMLGLGGLRTLEKINDVAAK